MTVFESGISWCTGTLNLTTGCTKVSAGCDNCYAEELVERLWKDDFKQIRYHEERLRDLRRFKPAVIDGRLMPKMVFVNSLSDWCHEKIPEDFIHRILDAFEQHPDVIVQLLTKRPVRARKIIARRYANRGVPENIWLGVSVEDARVKKRLDIFRRLKDQVGDFTLFASVEPITASCAGIDLTAVDWALTGGESKKSGLPRPMAFEHLEEINELALGTGVALHFKQYGHAQNNPYVQQISDDENVPLSRAFKLAVERGLEIASHEKGGATYKGRVIQQKPPAYQRMVDRLNTQPALL